MYRRSDCRGVAIRAAQKRWKSLKSVSHALEISRSFSAKAAVEAAPAQRSEEQLVTDLHDKTIGNLRHGATKDRRQREALLSDEVRSLSEADLDALVTQMRVRSTTFDPTYSRSVILSPDWSKHWLNCLTPTPLLGRWLLLQMGVSCHL